MGREVLIAGNRKSDPKGFLAGDARKELRRMYRSFGEMIMIVMFIKEPKEEKVKSEYINRLLRGGEED